MAIFYFKFYEIPVMRLGAVALTRMYGQMDGHTDGRTDRQTDRQTNRRTDGVIPIYPFKLGLAGV